MSLVHLRKVTKRSIILIFIHHDSLRSLPFSGIYIIFGHFRTVMKRSKILIFYLSRYSKVSGAS
ncbi:hypothetical protein H5410_031085 [Solanum commersonii]|uniref:Uncharacterized protein n=1 Tax=Solanum commersonii TaxID=4109 RepID=A0A9J5YG48_SOLCO|nr:hypothetical protein H5410_031085 [Solanum commersonii]